MDHTYGDEFQRPSGKRPLTAFQVTEDIEPPKKRPSYGERLALRVREWLDLIPGSSATGPAGRRETTTGRGGFQGNGDTPLFSVDTEYEPHQRRAGWAPGPQVDDAIFSIAANQYTAELLVSYLASDKDGDDCYYTRRVASFLLSDPDHFIKFRRYVKNIVDWGKGHRLRQILAALDYLVELERKEDEAKTKEEDKATTEKEEAMTRKEKETMANRYNLRPRRRK
ncbi:uncharacterized protein PG986_012629 [Apiospora aurea]|uniref:DUF7924 domain-containing protein n=1 Tax=Apiospora aurea TaxID=335848 RepID=A0ABR1Q0I6_9PEZI